MKTVYINESAINSLRTDEAKKGKKRKSKKPSAMSQVHNRVNAGIMDAICIGGGMCEGAEPESDKYSIGFEDGANSYAHVNEERGITNFSTENVVIKELIDTIIKWIPRVIDEKNAVKKIETVNKDVLSIRVHDDPIKKDFTHRLFLAKLKNGSMKPFIRTKYSCTLPSSITKGKFAGFENLKVIINVINSEEIRDKEQALSLIHEQYGGWSWQKYSETFGSEWNVDWEDGELYQFAKPWKNPATAGARAGKFDARGNDGKPFSWWTKLKDGKVNWLELQINKVECVNGVPYNTDSLPGLIYHEINHEYDNYYELKRTNGGTTSLGFRHDDDAMTLNRYALGLMNNESGDLQKFSIGCILYAVYVPGELDAHAVQAFGDLQNIGSKRGSFNDDLKKTNAYKEYQLAVESLERLKNYKELGWDREGLEELIRLAPIVGEDYKWYDSNGKLNGTNVERDRRIDYCSKYGYTDGPEKYKNREDPEIEAKYAQIKPAKKSLVSKSSTLESFIAQSEKRLNKLIKKMGKVSSLYYDESEKGTEATGLNEAVEGGVNYKKYMKQIARYMSSHGLKVRPFPKIKLDDSEQDGLFIKTGYYAPEEKLVVVYTNGRHPKDVLRSFSHEMIHHHQNLSGKNLSFTNNDNVKDNKELEELEAEAYLKGNIFFRKWTEHFKNEEKGLLNESILREFDESDVNLSSFKVKRELNPKFWVDEHLDKRIRMRLLDLADDFIKDLDIDWVEPKDILLTGSLANYNWDKKYSDIDLHILLDYEDVDENVDFVRSYFTAKKDLWNEKHADLRIFGFPVEVYVQDVNQKHNSSGIYSLDKDKWIDEPEYEKLHDHNIDGKSIKKSVAKYATDIDKLYDEFKEAGDDKHKIEVVHDKAKDLFSDIKKERDNGFSSDKSEMNSGNLTFKALRRMDYIGKLVDLKAKTYDIINSLD